MRALGLVLGAVLLLGCGSMDQRTIPVFPVEGTPDEVFYDVPLILQNTNYSCATTSVAMAISCLQNLTVPVDQDEVWRLSQTDKERVLRTGNDMAGLRRVAEHYGFASSYAQGLSVGQVEGLLAQGALVVLNIRAFETGTATHAVLATGYNRRNRTLKIADPAGQLTEMTYEQLERRWSAFLSNPWGLSTHSGFIVYPRKEPK